MKTFIAISAATLLGACSPGQVALNNGAPNYHWIGCHVVVQNPSPTGEWATSVHAGDLPIGAKFYFKQANHDGTVGPVTTGVPCNDD